MRKMKELKVLNISFCKEITDATLINLQAA